jgi:hypothetical protein
MGSGYFFAAASQPVSLVVQLRDYVSGVILASQEISFGYSDCTFVGLCSLSDRLASCVCVCVCVVQGRQLDDAELHTNSLGW